jgi:hypothetical protein
MGQYSAVIGRKTYFLYVPSTSFQAVDFFEPITALYFLPIIKSRNFVERQRERQWSTPAIYGLGFKDVVQGLAFIVKRYKIQGI